VPQNDANFGIGTLAELTMRRRTIWTLAGGVAAVLIIAGAVVAEWLLGLSQRVLNPVRYRVETRLEVGDHGRIVRSAFVSDCWALVATRGVVQGVRKSRRGEDGHVLLADGSILLLSDLDPCRWVDRVPAVDTTLTLAPGSTGPGALRPGEAWRFDNVAQPRTVTVYDLPRLFGKSSDGIGIRSAAVAVVAPPRDVAFTLEGQFGWLRAVPRGNMEEDQQTYWELHHHGNFLGFRATVTELAGGARCPARDPTSEGPVVIPMQAPCAAVSACRPAEEPRPCGRRIAWLSGTLNHDLDTLEFASADASDAKVGVLYREAMLEQSGAPGGRSHPSLRWQPRICLDGLCVQGETASIGEPPWTQFYFPRRNQLVTIWPWSFYAGDAFRRNGASF